MPDEMSKPLNMVIKLSQIDGKDCVKLSDDKGKVSPKISGFKSDLTCCQYTGNIEEVRRVQRELGLPGDHEETRRG